MKGVTILFLILLVHTFDAHNKHGGRMTKLEKKHTLKREAAIERIRELYEKLDEKDSEESERRTPPNISNFPVWKRKQDSSDSDCDSSSTKDSSDCESSSSTDEIRSSTSRLHKQSNSKHQKHATGHKATLNLLQKFEEQFKRLLKKLIPRVKERIHIIEMLKYHKINPCQSLSPLQFFYKRLYEYNKARYMAWRNKLEIRNYILSHMNHLDAEAIMRKCNIQRNIPYALRRAQMKRCINVYASIKKIFKIVTKLPRPSLNPADEILWLCNKTSLPTSSTTLEKNSKDAETTAKITTTADADNYPSPITDSESKNHTSTTESTRHRGSIKAPSSTITSKETENTNTSRISPISSAAETATKATNTIQSHITTISSSSKPSSLTTSETTRRTHRKRLTTSSVPIEQPSPTITIHSKNRTPSRERPKTWSSALKTNAGTATIEGQTDSIISNNKPSLVTNDTTEQANTNGFTNTSRPIDQTSSKTTIRNKNTTHLNERPTPWNSVGTTATGTSKIGGLKETIISNSKPSLITTVKTIVDISSEHTPTANIIQERITTLSKERPAAWSSEHNTIKRPATATRKDEVIISGTKQSLGKSVKTIVNRPSEHTPTANIIQERITTLSKERLVAWSGADTTTERLATVARKEEVIISGSETPLVTTVNTIVNRPSEHTPTANIIQERITTLSKERPVTWSSAHNTTKRPATVARKEEVIISGTKPSLETTVKTIVNRPSEHTPIPNVIQERITTLSKEIPVAWSSAHTATKRPATVAGKEEVIINGSKPPLVTSVKTIVNRPSEHTPTANIIQERITTLSKKRPAAWSSEHNTTKRPATATRKEELIISGTKQSLGKSVKTIVNRPSEHTPTANIIQERITTLSKERLVAWSGADTTTERLATVARKEEVIISGSETPLVTTVNTIVNRPSEHTPTANIIQERITTLSKERPVAWSSAHTTIKRPATVARKEEVIISGSKPPLVTTVKMIVNRPNEHTPTENIIQERVTTLSKERPAAWRSAQTTTKRPATEARKEELILSGTKPLLGTTVKTIVNRPSEHMPSANIIQERITTLSKERPVTWSSADTATKGPATVARKEELIISGSKPSLLSTANAIGHTSTGGSTNGPRPSEHTSSENIIQERISTLSGERPAAWSSADTATKGPATVARKEELIISGSKPSLLSTANAIGHTSTGGSTNGPRPSEHTSSENIIQERISTLSGERPAAWSSADTATKGPATVARKEELIISGSKPLLGTTVKTIEQPSRRRSTSSPGPSEHTSSGIIIQERISSLSRERPVAWSSAHTTSERTATVARKEEMIISGSRPSLGATVKTIGYTGTDGSTSGQGISEHSPSGNIIQERISTLSSETPVAWSSAHTTTKTSATVARKEAVIISGSKPSLGATVKMIAHTSTSGSTSRQGSNEHAASGNIIQERISTLSRERPAAWSSADTATKGPAAVARKEEVIISDSKPSLLPTTKTLGHTSTGASTSRPGPSEHTSSANIIQERISSPSKERTVAWSSAHTTTKKPATVARIEEVIISDSKPSLETTVKTLRHTSTGGSTSSQRPSEHSSSGNIIQEEISTLSRELPAAWSSAHTTTKRPATVARKEEVIISGSKPSLLTTAKAIVHSNTGRSTSSPKPDYPTSPGNIVQELIRSLLREKPAAWSSADTATKRPATVGRKEEVIINGSKPPSVTTVTTIVNRPNEHTPTANIIQKSISTRSKDRPAALSSAHNTAKRPATAARKEEVIISDTKPSLGTTVKTIVNRPSEHTPTANIIQERITTMSWDRPTAWIKADTISEGTAKTARENETIIIGSNQSLVTTVEANGHTSGGSSASNSEPAEQLSTGTTTRGTTRGSPDITDEVTTITGGHKKIIISSSKPSFASITEGIGHTSTERSTSSSRPSEQTSSGITIHDRISTLSKETPTAWSKANTTSDGTAITARQREAIFSGSKSSSVKIVETIGHTSTERPTSRSEPTEQTSPESTIYDRINTISSRTPTIWSSANTKTEETVTAATHRETIISNSKPSLGTIIKTIVHTDTDRPTSEPTEQTSSGTIIYDRINTISSGTPISWSGADTTIEGTVTAVEH